MTAATLCGITGVDEKSLEDSVAYPETWVARLKSDSRLIVSTASRAPKAADFIQNKAV
jgi:antirestriction protein ArdC